MYVHGKYILVVVLSTNPRDQECPLPFLKVLELTTGALADFGLF